MSDPIRHHYVPGVLLRRFTSDGKMLARIERSGETEKATATSVCVVKDFYTLEGEGWEDRLWIERHSDKALERPAGAAFRALVEPGGFPPSDEHRRALARFVAWQFMRGPDARELINTPTRYISDVVLSPLSQLLSRDRVIELLRSVGLPVDASGSLVKNAVLHLQTRVADALAESLFDMKLALVRFPSLSLITSDRPVVLWGKFAPGTPSFGVGIDLPHALSIHLDPRHALLFVPRRVCGDDWGEPIVDGLPHHAETLNRRAAAWSWERVFHHPGHAPLDGSPLPTRSDFREALRGAVLQRAAEKPWPVRWALRRWLA